MMQSAARASTVAQPGGKIQVEAPDLTAGETVEVIILSPETTRPSTLANQQPAIPTTDITG